MSHDLFFSPLDGRYKNLLNNLLSEESSLDFQIRVELAWMESLIDAGIAPKVDSKIIQAAFETVTQEKINEIEQRTQHATRALVEALSQSLVEAGQEKLSHWVHVGLTSFDTVDTALRLRLKEYLKTVYSVEMKNLTKTLKSFALKHKDQKQCGRTHGQWAVPTYFGLSVAEAVSRIERLEQKLDLATEALCGQSSGAIGGYHASALLTDKALDLEANFLKKLGLQHNYASVQTLPIDDILGVANEIFLLSSTLTKLANDWRHLARSEICEVTESLAPGQVGSSTMPQKRNPWNLEHICSLFKILSSRLSLLQSDSFTEHQRDLTNSASGRFYFELFAIAHLILIRFQRILPRIEVNSEMMKKHYESASASFYSEAFYILLTKNNVPHAHDVVRQAARKSEESGETVLKLLQKDGHLALTITHEKLETDILSASQQKFQKIAQTWKQV